MRIRVVRPSSREQNDLLPQRLDWLRLGGHVVHYDDITLDPDWTYTAAHPEVRAQALTLALTETSTDVVWSARGGYGASELLNLMDWQKLSATRAKPLVGFSDISALHSALYAKLGWSSIHAPMPATSLWLKDDETRDVTSTLALLENLTHGKPATGSIRITPVGTATPETLIGTLFGGCFTVITNLIGTPYFPSSLAGHILFFEDLDEHPGRLMRAWQQWIQSGALGGVRAVIIGNLKNLGARIQDNAAFVLNRFAHFSPVPVYHSTDFGHCCPNFPLVIGATATIQGPRLEYSYLQNLS